MRFLAISIALALATSGLTLQVQIVARVSPQQRLRSVFEEVQVPIAAYDNFGHPDPTLVIEDLVVLENGVPQEVRSIRRIPANVVLLLDTGEVLNSVKSVRITRAVAKKFLSALDTNYKVSVIQFNDKVELLHGWTHDFKRVDQVLDIKLFSGRRSHFSDGLIATVNQFDQTPIGSRHIVLITDGVQSPGGKNTQAHALKQVAASNAVVHAISYTSISAKSMTTSRRIVRNRDKSIVQDEAVNTVPENYKPLRRAHEPGGVIADVDPDRFLRGREDKRILRDSEYKLTDLVRESGGSIWLPQSLDEMLANGAATARLINASYVVTYKPKRSPVSAAGGEVRRIEVVSRRVGLTVVSPRRYTVFAKPSN